MKSRRTIAIGTALAAVAVLAIALPLFQPWRLFTDKVVDEALPGAAPVSMTSSSPAPPTISDGRDSAPSPTAGPPSAAVQLAVGRFITHEHGTSGSAAIVRLPDGSRILRLEQLATSDGPDLEVWLSDAEVVKGKAGWHVFDDGRYLSLGRLKGNQGNQNYPIPADVDLKNFSSVSIWCNRFNVSFGAAALTPA
ncbi:DM13 domain-containing protein [Kribbella qitaiheensis]|uniref:DM13 domain-containing protein n=1 Tax=Kribbella qitaiheensis TaxID=1544730 RepID=A0A7G6X7C5_9ACTN|nr:DM13 domain-containing protein [Kribbella qitaiheensis]QNE22140.1 DM13 domain-containing protein [Kribbella qitaiheensis]